MPETAISPLALLSVGQLGTGTRVCTSCGQVLAAGDIVSSRQCASFVLAEAQLDTVEFLESILGAFAAFRGERSCLMRSSYL